jgi:predicted  nucleic acid-binding Zn-ribbon protein
LQNEIKLLQDERESLLDSNKNCTQELSEVILEDRLKENIIKGLRNDMSHAAESVESAKSSRSQEIAILTQNIEDLQVTLANLQQQYDEGLEKILSQNTQIRELQEKLADYEYISSRNLRG